MGNSHEVEELMGYCRICEQWHPFRKSDPKWECPIHHTRFSQRHGEQITSKRTYREKKKR